MKTRKAPKMPAALLAAVRAYLLARTHAAVMRDRVDAIKTEVLAEAEWWTDAGDPAEGARRRITEPAFDWRMATADHERYLVELDRRARAAGLKPDTMPADYCPALVAESVVMQAAACMVDLAAPFVGFEQAKPGDLWHRLVCAGQGKREEFLGLLVKLALATPGFEASVRRELGALGGGE